MPLQQPRRFPKCCQVACHPTALTPWSRKTDALNLCDQRPEQRVWLQLRQIHLLMFDEAHHCVSRNPGNVIMQQFYHSGQGLKVRQVAGGTEFYLHVVPLDVFGFGSITLQTGA